MPVPGIVLEDDRLLLTVFKQAEESADYVIRLFEPSGKAGAADLHIPAWGLSEHVDLRGFEKIKTFKLDVSTKTITEWALMEGL